MANTAQRATGRFTSFFTSVSAGEVKVGSLPAGSAGTVCVPSQVLSSLAGLFSVSPDTSRLMAPVMTAHARRFIPAQSASQVDVMLADMLAAD